MSQKKIKIQYSTEEAWNLILDKYDIVNEIKKNGVFHIKASQIKEFREPRLMSKWDSSEQLPKPLSKNKINILPDSRSSYVLGDFLLYESIPELKEHIKQMTAVELPEYETIDIDNINSESNAINILIISRILDDFLSTEENVSTFNGRMSSGQFEFNVDSYAQEKRHIVVNNAQLEIDGGFENEDSVVILEAKNVVHKDFHVRQLYYPYRLWKSKVNKPIRCVFSIYSNKVFRLFEYKFEDINDYSSIKLVQTKNYSLEDTTITLEDLKNVLANTTIKYDDDMEKQTKDNTVPFIQADSFDRVVSLLENMKDNPMNDEEIAELMHFGSSESNGHVSYRQSQYYRNAGKYLGLFEKDRDDDKGVVTKLSSLGIQLYKMKYKERQLKFVSLMLEHQIFNDVFVETLKCGEILSKEAVVERMKELNVCGDGQLIRRAQSVRAWVYWILNLIDL